MLKQLLEMAQDLIAPGVVEERRSIIRVQCQITVEVSGPDGTQLSTLTNVSPKGMRLEGPTNQGKGQSLQVMLPKSKLGPVTGQVVWCKPVANTRNFTTGLVYTDNPQALGRSWLKDKLRELGFDAAKVNERRNYIRFPAPSQQAYLVDGNDEIIAEGRLVNIGYGGALVALVTQVECGTGVRLVLEACQEIPALDTVAVVRSFYKSAKKFYVTGLQFERPGQAQVRRYVRAVKKKMGI